MKNSDRLTENYKRVIKACEEESKIYTLERFPICYASIQHYLGSLYTTLAELEEDPENLKRALNAYKEALKVFTEEKFPSTYQHMQSSLLAGQFVKLGKDFNLPLTKY